MYKHSNENKKQQEHNMTTPSFYESVPSLTLYDPLSEFLGAVDKGLITYTYLDAVKCAGHSCPTVASAYAMLHKGLEALYKGEIPLRGGMKVFFKEAQDEGVTGVIANLFSLVTGAAQEGGFKGIAGKFERRGLLSFSAPISLHVKMQRLDTGASVELSCDVSSIAPDSRMNALMPKVLRDASVDEKALFASLWQERVKRILENIDTIVTVKKD